MSETLSAIDWLLILAFAVTQLLYLGSFLVDAYLLSRPRNMVDMDAPIDEADMPDIVLLYPVLRESEAVMRTTMTSLAAMDYPAARWRVVAVPNHDDRETIASLTLLQADFPFLEVLPTPPTTHPSWEAVWRSWTANPKAYWWHRGRFARRRDLPPKKTRQLVHAFYTLHAEAGGRDFLLNYIDADSAPPRDHFRAGAIGMRRYDVLQSTNIAGNLNDTLAASWHAFDHIAWDGRKYPHLSANGRHPYWVLGKGLFFRASDLAALGGFHPWMAIEDPEVGMRFWANGKRLGIIAAPLIEEVPETLGHGITQRKRWVCGFFESLGTPLGELGFSRRDRIRAWTNFLPCMSLWVNAVGLPVGIWAAVAWAMGVSPLPPALVGLALVNIAAYLVTMATLYAAAWRRTALVLDRKRDRLRYMLRVNPLFLAFFWMLWLVPLWMGWRMYRRDSGRVWERTEKIDANADLVRTHVVREGGAVAPALAPPAVLPAGRRPPLRIVERKEVA